MTKSPESSPKHDNLYDVFKYAKDERHAFLMADLFFGSAALWLPILLGIMFWAKTSPWDEFVKLLDSGGGYTFALAFLAAGSSFLYLDRRKDVINDFREEVWPNVWTWCQSSLAIGTVLTAIHFAAQILNPEKGNGILNTIEFLYFLWAFRLGVRLFCLRNIESLPGGLDKYRKAEEEKVKKIAEAAASNAPY